MDFPKSFVCEDTAYSTYEAYVPAPLFRKAFVLPEQAQRAQVLICGLGFYDLFVNGERITKGRLAPYIANTDHIAYYDAYDIAPYLRSGENVIGVMLGDGNLVGKCATWNYDTQASNAAPMLAITVELQCGAQRLSFGPEDFLCKKGPILYNDLRTGVHYDARLEEPGWCSPGFVGEGWHRPIPCAGPRGRAKLCQAEPVRVYRQIAPVSVTRGEIAPYTCKPEVTALWQGKTLFAPPPAYTGGYIYDFGENNAGIYRLKLRGQKGQRVDIQCAERLVDGKLDYNSMFFYPDGYAQRDVYYLRGEGEECFEPPFTFHGFRYLYISGITEEQATEDLVTYLVMSSELEERGSFACSDPVANTVFEMARRSDRSNFFYFPMDCPHREKNGWTGDAALSAEHMLLTMGAESSWREWLCNVRAAQTPEGQLPGIVPTDTWGYAWGNGPAWDRVLFELPWLAWRYRGDLELLRENADGMLRYLKYAAGRRDARGIVEWGLGDWLPVDRECWDAEAELGFTSSVMLLDMCRKGAQLFEAAQLPEHRAYAQTLGQQMYTAIRQTYVQDCTVQRPCQTAQAMGLFYGIFTPQEQARAFRVLMQLLEQADFNFTCGCLGLRVLFHVLAEQGQGDLAYGMITKPEFPSYGYWAAQGATTLWDQFYSKDAVFGWSMNHHFLGDIVNWFMTRVGGLQVVRPDFVQVKPCVVEALSWCRTTHKLPGGEIEIYWQRKGEKTEVSVTCTGNVQYEILSE